MSLNPLQKHLGKSLSELWGKPATLKSRKVLEEAKNLHVNLGFLKSISNRFKMDASILYARNTQGEEFPSDPGSVT